MAEKECNFVYWNKIYKMVSRGDVITIFDESGKFISQKSADKFAESDEPFSKLVYGIYNLLKGKSEATAI